MERMETLDDALLDGPIAGVNLRGGTLRAELGDEPTLLVFLRHFGCIFCREVISDARRAAEGDAGFPRVVFFYRGSAEEGVAFFAAHWPGAAAVADSDGRLYAGFGLEHGAFNELLGPAVWVCGLRAMLKGHWVGKANGDPLLMPGVLLVQGPRVLYRHEFRHAGDHPDFGRLVRKAGAVVKAAG